jgi:hypothetical protein
MERNLQHLVEGLPRSRTVMIRVTIEGERANIPMGARPLTLEDNTVMKRTFVVTALFVAAVFLTATASSAQDINTSFELLRSDIKTRKLEILTKAMKLDESQGAVFWPVYRKYDAELSKINDEKIAVLREYSQRYESMTDQNATEMMKKLFDTEEQMTELKEKYFRKFTKVLSARTAARVIQVENYLNRLVDLSVAGEVPLVPRPEDIKPETAVQGGAMSPETGK